MSAAAARVAAGSEPGVQEISAADHVWGCFLNINQHPISLSQCNLPLRCTKKQQVAQKPWLSTCGFIDTSIHMKNKLVRFHAILRTGIGPFLY